MKFCRNQYVNLQDKDPVVPKLWDSSEEGQKVTRNDGPKLLAVYRHVKDPHENS